MIAIFSIDGDVTTDLVISWLKYYDCPYIRINSYDVLSGGFNFDIKNKGLLIKNTWVDINKIKFVWFRKFGFYQRSIHNLNISKYIGDDAANHINKEFNELANLLYLQLSEKKWLNHPHTSSPSKIKMLILAQRYGLNVPDTHVLNDKKTLIELNKNKQYITKSIFNPSFIYREEGVYTMYTSRLTSEKISKLPSVFFPSLVQEEIRKEYEIRSFFLEGEFFSMAIFSQELLSTEVDFRRYSLTKPNRYVPYCLPKEIEAQLSNVLRELGLNCASIDLIKGTDKKYYFLEVNPTGQFGMIDFNCNYGLHHKVSEYLIKRANETETI